MLDRLLSDFLEIDADEMREEGFLERRATQIKQCVENVNNGKGWIERKECPICGSKNFKPLFTRFGVQMVQCQDCTCGFPDKEPVDSADVCCHEDYTPIIRGNALKMVDYKKERFGKERLGIIRNFLDSDVKKPRLLDVGCGSGWFIEQAREEGFDIAGQEFGKQLADETSEYLNAPIWSGPITDISLDETFDVITLFDVIEHVPNPKEVLQSVKDHLNPGGISLIFTPNLESFCIEELKERSSQVMPAEHLFLFTMKSFKMIADEVGLSIGLAETKGIDIPDIYSYYRDDLKQLEVANFLKEHCSVLQAMIDRAGCGNHMRFVLKKEKE